MTLSGWKLMQTGILYFTHFLLCLFFFLFFCSPPVWPRNSWPRQEACGWPATTLPSCHKVGWLDRVVWRCLLLLLFNSSRVCILNESKQSFLSFLQFMISHIHEVKPMSCVFRGWCDISLFLQLNQSILILHDNEIRVSYFFLGSESAVISTSFR